MRIKSVACPDFLKPPAYELRDLAPVLDKRHVTHYIKV